MTTTRQAADELGWTENKVLQLGILIPGLVKSKGRGQGGQSTWNMDALRITALIYDHFKIGLPSAARIALHAKIDGNRLIIELPD